MKPATQPRRRRTGAALLGLLFGVLCLLPAAVIARAEEARPAMELLEVGWDGHVTAGAWAPVRVKVTGAARDLDALVEVTLENQYQTGPTTTFRFPMAAYAQEVSLPANATKEVTVWVPTGYGLQGTVRLKGGGQELGQEPIDFRTTKAPYWPLVGALSGEERLESALKAIELPLQGLPTAINVARLKPEGLPTVADRLKGLRAMVVQGNAPSNLTDPQRKAILEWVKGGGHLLLAGGPDSALTAAVLPAGTLPVAFSGAQKEIDLAPLLTWLGTPQAMKGPAVRMQPTGGAVLAGTAEQPLLWRTALGKGTISVLAVDPALEPLASYSGLTPLLKKALGPALVESASPEDEKFRLMQSEQEQSYRLRAGIDNLPQAAYPGWKQVALYLGGFGLLVGPAIHLLFWSNKRRGWVWLAVPAASVAVAGGIYAAGIALGGRDIVGHTISYVQIDPATQTAGQMMMVGLYAPMHKDLAITLPADLPVNALGLLEAQRFGSSEKPADERPPFRVVTGRETRVEFNANEWVMRPLALSRTLGKETGHMTAHLALEGDLIKGSITNDTPYHLEDAAVAAGSRAVRLGRLAPGQTVAVTLDPAGGIQNPFQYVPLSTLFFGEPMKLSGIQQQVRPSGAYEPMEVPREPEIQRRSRLLESLLHRPKAGPDTASLPLSFIAFTQDTVGSDLVDLKGHPSHHLSLIEQRLQLELPAGPFKLPSALIPSDMNMAGVRGMGSNSNGAETWMEIDSGSVSYTFTPPLPRGAEVTALEITTKMMGAPVPVNPNGPRKVPPGPVNPSAEPAVEGIFQIYNYSTAAWESLPGGQESVRLTNVGPYLGPEGEVKVQAFSGGGQMIRFVVPGLTMEGRGSK